MNSGGRMNRLITIPDALQYLCGGTDAEWTTPSSLADAANADERAWAAVKGYARGINPHVDDMDVQSVIDIVTNDGDSAVADQLIRREWKIAGIVEDYTYYEVTV